MSTMYQVQLDESTRLPMTADAVRDAWQRGRVQANTPLWRDGLDAWQPAHALREELQLPEQLGGFRPQGGATYEEPEPVVRDGGMTFAGVLLIVFGVALAGYFLWIYETRILSLGSGLWIAGAEQLQNRTYGIVAGVVMAVIGVVVLARRRN